MKLIVGLGNPGKEYENTKHNVGFNCIDYIVNNLNLGTKKHKFNADTWTYNINNEKFMFVKPLSYMNLSGVPVMNIATYFDVNVDDIFVIYDDKDLEFSDIKIKNKGSSGGHNGINNIIDNFGTKKIKRIKVGIGYDNKYLIKNWVLSTFNTNEKKELNKIYKRVNIIVEELFKNYDFDKISSLNNFNK